MDKIHTTESLELFGDVKGKTAILVDDIVTSAGTLIHAADRAMEQGAKRVVAAIAHHDFSEKAPGRIEESPIERFFTTDTILLKPEQKFKKLQEVSMASIIAADLKRFAK